MKALAGASCAIRGRGRGRDGTGRTWQTRRGDPMRWSRARSNRAHALGSGLLQRVVTGRRSCRKPKSSLQGTHDAPVRLIGRRAILTATPGSAQMGHWPTVSKLVFFDVGSGAIRWGGDWHEGVDERKFAGSLAVGRRNGTGRRGGGLTL